MHASIKWLNDYVSITEAPEILADQLTMAGIPVASVDSLGQNIQNVVTGKVIEVNPHPAADRLSVCKINIGENKVTIVTGATNVRAGQIVPVALEGAKLPSGKAIEAADLRGVMSQGMLCSAEELNLDAKIIAPELREGIYILPAETAVGIDIQTALGLDDTVLEFELTPNRADCFSVIGLAREVAVLTNTTVKKPMLALQEQGESKASALATVAITEPALCSRFAARILQNVKVAPSPVWMQHRLQAAGMRPINNIVDVTNFVMLEMGQPMHAYDYSLLARHSITVRKANPGEKLTTLDGVKRELHPETLVIADAVQAVGIAGVMGGLATEVTAATQTVLLEAAAFQGASVRRSSRALGLRSEASGRFERGVDTANITRALDRAAKLLEDMGACKVCPGIIDNYPGITLPRQVVFTAKQINAFLGTEIPQATMVDILRRLEFELDVQGERITVTVPTWRSDVTGPADISEEVARIYGYNKVPTTTPSGRMTRGSQSYTQSIADRLKSSLAGIGFTETISFSFMHPNTLAKLNYTGDSHLYQGIEIRNPITDEFPWLRTTLLGGIMDVLVRNLSRKNEDLKIFELGAVYQPEQLPLQDLPNEPLMLCGALCGRRTEVAWNQPQQAVDFYDAKGAVEELLANLGITQYTVKAGEHPSLHPGKTAIFTIGDETVATVGELHPKVQAAFGINRKVYVFEIPVKAVVNQTRLIGKYEQLPKFPAIARDLALVLPVSVPASQVTDVIVENGGNLLADVKLFDVYTGEQVPDGYRSLAYSLVFRAVDRTLTDAEVETHHKNILVHLEKTLSAKLRD
ncbi:phenylalanine--tRNA ligase subunit beta [Anaerospora hongkongensis]|uniref:phenylalanine--tRNA ligase subunit beta n=1 Tax=Anaerospora hongkongensis TaxID=244830 RepID=UPI00289D6852|nr:phenylalanine--tRNA ligase subunit beta [Anaerospora hongkongensis]